MVGNRRKSRKKEENDRTERDKFQFCQDLSGTAQRLLRFVKRKEPEPPTGDSGRQGQRKDAEGGSSLSLPLEIVGGKGSGKMRKAEAACASHWR